AAGDGAKIAPHRLVRDWSAQPAPLGELVELLATGAGGQAMVTNIRNRRVTDAADAIDPEALCRAIEELGATPTIAVVPGAADRFTLIVGPAAGTTCVPPPPAAYRSYVREPTHSSGRRDLLEDVRRGLQRTLPAYMVPSELIALEALPTTPS